MSLQGPPFEVVTRILLLYSCVFGPRWSTKSTFWRFQHADNEMASRRSVPGLSGRNVRLAQSKVSLAGCEEPFSLCTERQYNRSYDPDYKGRYIGHDEPAVLFYSDVPGSGNYT